MEDMVTWTPAEWRGRSVLVTGHTGFKGGWLALWLNHLGATLHGFALEPPTDPNLFEVARIRDLFTTDVRADVADFAAVRTAVQAAGPNVIFHLAAQALVRESYRDPLGTLSTNVMGTAHVLEAARLTDSVQAVVVITTDKVYENREWEHPYREGDPLGGRDPYSASKAAAEVVSGSYRASFFGTGTRHPARVATARAGNVLGGADWAADRLVPDCLRAFTKGESVQLRYPNAVRPWQHVLEPLSGYLLLAEHLLGTDGEGFATAWNFGPDAGTEATVGEVASATARLWGKGARVENKTAAENPHEAGFLRLDNAMARSRLGWKPRWSLEEALEHTVAWHRAWTIGADMPRVSYDQIRAYEAAAAL